MRPSSFADASGVEDSGQRVVRGRDMLICTPNTRRWGCWTGGDSKPRPGDSYISLSHLSRDVRPDVASCLRARYAARRVPLAALGAMF